ncbi:MAG: pilus assembly protein PilC [Oceanospirillales bacterium]|nr:pilus assembly protein PilC [Oceanospirillales bacterium]
MKRWLALSSFLIASLGFGSAQAEVSQQPLFLGGGVPGNLAIVPSVEWPTINSVANIGAFDPDKTYVGYFDSFKCYDYVGSRTESNRRFEPKTVNTDRLCDGASSGYWSGNLLNWATTQTIDPFRKALTGGLRAKDEADDTWLEKAWHDGQGWTFHDRTITRATLGSDIDDLLPFGFDVDSFTVQVGGYGKQMLFSFSAVSGSRVSVDRDYRSNGSGAYYASVRVQVCVDGLLESNCTQYTDSSGNTVWKPEGLLQEYSDKIRYSVFGYLNDSSQLRDGGVLRARQKYIGLQALDPASGWGANTAVEWDSQTGVFKQNPDSIDASATESNFGVTVNYSGVINYINRFEEQVGSAGDNFKSHDPVSELYYAATRYFRGMSEVSAYSSFSPSHDSSPSSSTKERWADGFPVVVDWRDENDDKDPIQYSCQKNAILGIGDVNTWRDRNLPGNNLSASGEPSTPSEVSSDNDVNVGSLLSKIESLEGINFAESSGRLNSAYIAGLALDIHTRDIRDDFDERQTVETYWVDVLEDQTLQGRSANQYWLAAKYGGFEPACPDNNPSCDLPEITGPYDTDLSSMTDDWWFTNGETLTQSGQNMKRADHYFTAGDAEDMVASLEQAFADIAASLQSTSTSLAFDSRTLESGSLVFQALFDSTHWSGDLVARSADTSSGVSTTQVWSTANTLDALSDSDMSNRKVFTAGDFASIGTGQDQSLATRAGRNFLWASLTSAQKSSLKTTTDGTGVTDSVGQKRLEYLRGVRANEQTATDTAKLFRQRGGRLGDIVNSDPQYLHKANFGYALLSGSAQYNDPSGTDVGAAYTEYRASDAYKNKSPVVVVGSNDGMLHGFNASETAAAGGGTELFAYVPVSVMGELYKLTESDYDHQYYVDGTPRLGDAWLGTTLGWRTLAVATTGAGGSGVFALDITDPDHMASADVLWEYTNPLMGKLKQQPALAALANGHFGVVVTSGYDAPQDEGYVWILDAADGSRIKRIDLPDARGLGSPLLLDLDSDRIADRIYVGDLQGQLWRIDIDSSNPGQWGVPVALQDQGSAMPLFTAVDSVGTAQPITAPLTAAFNGDGKLTLLFGTGAYFRVNDDVVSNSPQVQSFYALYDEGAAIDSRDDLQSQEIVIETTVGDFGVRVISDNAVDNTKSGWYLDLAWMVANGGPGAQGERVISKATITGDQVVFNTMIPSDDPCASGGDSWIMALELSNGGRSSTNLFDYNGDGVIDDKDSVTVTVQDAEGNETEVQVPGSGLSTDKGIVDSSTVEGTSSGSGYRYVCFAGSSDTTPECVLMNGSMKLGRVSWRELTTN